MKKLSKVKVKLLGRRTDSSSVRIRIPRRRGGHKNDEAVSHVHSIVARLISMKAAHAKSLEELRQAIEDVANNYQLWEGLQEMVNIAEKMNLNIRGW